LQRGRLLTLDPVVEESPQRDDKGHQADLVAHHDLRADSPPEERHVRRVSGQGVDACADELVALLLDSLRRVVEVRAGRRHGCAAHQLSEDDQCQANGDSGEVDETGLIRRKEHVRDNNLEQSGTVGHIVRPAVAEQQEAAGARLG
jgi:hypothetical protein